MSKMSRTILAFGLFAGSATIAEADETVPGGWDSQVGAQSFSEYKPSAYPMVGRVGVYGYGVVPGSRPLVGMDSSSTTWSTIQESRTATYNGLFNVAKTVRRSSTNRRRSGR